MKYLSALVTQGSGVLGNLVVERNGVMRNRNIPTNPSTILQQAARATLAFYSQSWSADLTDVNRLAWNDYAATVNRTDVLGKPIKLSGIDMYVSANAALAVPGLPAVTVAPPDSGALNLPAVESVVIDDSAGTCVATFATDIPGTQTVSLFLSPASVSQGRSSYAGPFRYHQSIAGTAAPTITFAGLTAQVAGEKWGYRLSIVDDNGRTGKDAKGLTLVVA